MRSETGSFFSFATALAVGVTVAVGASALGSADARAESLNIYAWSGELPQEIVDDFAKETGIDVTMDTFDSNESLIAKLEAGAAGYDIVNPSQYAVQILAKKGLIEELDHGKIPNRGNLSEVFQNISYDPGNKYSVPYVWGTTGLAYNSECVKEPVTSWKALWDEKYAGRIYMLDNMLAAYIAGLQVNGFKANTTNPDEIAKATDSLIEQKKILAGYNSTAWSKPGAAPCCRSPPRTRTSTTSCLTRAARCGSTATRSRRALRTSTRPTSSSTISCVPR